MTPRYPAPPQELREARRALEEHPHVHPAGEFLYNSSDSSWALPIEVVSDGPGGNGIPPTSRWFIVVLGEYPWGSIEVYPAKSGGIAGTYQHQDYNGPGAVEVPWRDGDVCIREQGFTLGRAGTDPDPQGQSHRLRWYADRLLEWVNRAASGRLVKAGDPFELPQFKCRDQTIGFLEDPATFAQWASYVDKCGVAELVPFGNPYPLAVRSFQSLKRVELVAPRWGLHVEMHSGSLLAPWVRLPRMPALVPYAAPMCWGELEDAARGQGIELLRLIEAALAQARVEQPVRILVGFPIPRVIGGGDVLMHWQPLLLERLSTGSTRGFRNTEASRRKRDRVTQFAGSQSLTWLAGQNWSVQVLERRGLLGAHLRTRRILVIGAGAIGSAVAELLIRGGADTLTVIDGDRLETGNLVRHSLTLGEVGQYKASALATRLNMISPHARASAVCFEYPPRGDAEKVSVDRFDLIIDCTAEDEVLARLANQQFMPEVEFLSVSLGPGAIHAYIYTARGHCFPFDKFRAAIDPHLKQDRAHYPEEDRPGEGAGCWHPPFRASVLDISRAALAAIAHAEVACCEEAPHSSLEIIECSRPPAPAEPSSDARAG